MENNQELFKQAILDAKAVRETAMAAARNTLAEHFEPFIKESMRETLSEDDMEENYSMEETDEMPTESTNDMEESTLDQILAELDALSEDMEDGSDMTDTDGISEGQVTTTAGYPEKAGAKHGNKDGSYSEKPGAKKGNTNASYSEKVKSSIHEAEEEEDDEKEEEDHEAEKAGKDLTHGIEQADDMEGGDEQEVVDITVGDLKDIIRDVFMQIQGGDDMAPEAPLDADTDLAADLGDDELGDEEDGLEPKEISLDEILAELELEEAALHGEIPGGEIDPKAKDVYKVEEMKKELNEAVRTIKVLKAELNEMNLFNAKMLYVNKIFKAKNLNEAQKTRVINAFDRTTSVKEVENTYKTLLESVGEAKKKTSIKESVGFASKPLGSAPARPIVEADAFVTRWQQLAGIK
jgi:hypothetical protein